MDGLDALFGKLVQLFPPEKFAYIGLGNSPVMLMIYLKLRYGADASVLALPLSAVGEEGFADHAKDSAAQKRVLAYMGQYLDPRALAGRQPLLLDYAAGGASLAIAGLYVRNFFVSRGYKALAKALMLVALSPGSKPRVVDAPPMPSQKIPTIGGLAEDVDGEPQGRVANRELYLRGLEDQRWKRDFGFGMWDKQGCDFEAVNRGDTIAGKFDATKFGRTATGVEAFHENNREGPGDAGARDPSVYLESQFWRALDKEIAATGGDASQLTAILLSLTRDQHRRLHDAYRHDIDLVLGYEGRVPEPIQRKVMAILDSGVASHGGPPSRERKPEPTDSKHVATASASDMPASASLSSSSPSSSLAKPPAMELSAAQPAFFAVTGTDLSGHFTSEVAAAIRRDAAKGDSRGVYCDNDGHSWKISEWMQSVDFYQFKPA